MAATCSLIQMLASGVVTSAGVPVASGQVFFYLPATTTPVSAYADSLAATPIAPPLVLTAGGTGIAYTKVPTRMVVKDASATTTIFDGLVNIERAEQQYIQSASINGGTETTAQAVWDALATSLGGTAGLWKFKAAASATERNLTSVINDFGISVTSFGADPTGATDSKTAFQNTINFVSGLGGGVVIIPPGAYSVSSAVTLSGSASIAVVGAGELSTVITNTSGSGNCFSITATSIFSLRGFTIGGASSGIGISVTNILRATIQDVTIGGHVKAIQGSALAIERVTATGTTGAGLTSSGTVEAVRSYFASASGGAAISITGAGDFAMVEGTIDISAGTAAAFATTGAVALVGVSTLGSGATVTLAAASGPFAHSACRWASGASITDGRTGAPVAYTFAADGNFTPLPLQTKAIRVSVTAAAVVTINAAAAMGFGEKFSIMLCRSTAGAVTWTFDAQYILQGAAAPAPTNGNMMISIFEYDPISAKYRETSRSASMAI